MSTTVSFATCLPAMMAITQAVLSSRVAAGTRWLRLGLDSASPIDLQYVASLAPFPTLKPVGPSWISRAWSAALAGKHSVFDTIVQNDDDDSTANPDSSTKATAGTTTNTSSSAMNVKSIPLDKLVSKLVSYINVSPTVLITSLILIDRLTTSVPEVLLNDGNVHKLYVIAFMLAAKLLEDDYYPASWFAVFLGCSDKHIKYLEQLFLKGIDYRAFVTSPDFDSALYSFTAEAIDSSAGLTVLASFPNSQLASQVVEIATSWRIYPQQQQQTTKSAPLSSYKACPPPEHVCLRALADAQLSHDCPGFGSDNPRTDFASRIYSPIGFIRLMSLKRLVDGLLAASLLPALELNRHFHHDTNSIGENEKEDTTEKNRVILEGLGWGNLYKRPCQNEHNWFVGSDFAIAPVYTAGSIWSNP